MSRLPIVVASAVMTSALLLQTSRGGDASAAAQPATEPDSGPAPQPAATPMPETHGPITYYVQNCARCHGDISAAYVGIKKPKRGAELRKIIDDMAAGPAQAPIDDKGLDEQVKLHEAMFDNKPYAWLDRTQNPPVAEKLENTEALFRYGDTIETPARTDGYRVQFHQEDGNLMVRKIETKK